ncbi:MAG TPA: hypothetical protein ENH32_06640 [Proteobacteria bacterium]|nr:hypothetical protein BMS3Abin14_00121 [bacterium BMS3Abin14]HDL53637.1 hypothetical protein [Pseudomonadota bacterium]
MDNLPHREYWKIFGNLIESADAGAVAGCLGWIFYWLDLVPDPLFRTHVLSEATFLVALLAGLRGMWIMVRTKNSLGTRKDRALHIAEISYAIIASLSGLTVNLVLPLQ